MSSCNLHSSHNRYTGISDDKIFCNTDDIPLFFRHGCMSHGRRIANHGFNTTDTFCQGYNLKFFRIRRRYHSKTVSELDASLREIDKKDPVK